MADTLDNPKLDDRRGNNTVKEPDNWVSGHDPMSSYLTTLCEEAGVDPPSKDLSKADVSKMIDELKAKLKL